LSNSDDAKRSSLLTQRNQDSHPQKTTGKRGMQNRKYHTWKLPPRAPATVVTVSHKMRPCWGRCSTFTGETGEKLRVQHNALCNWLLIRVHDLLIGSASGRKLSESLWCFRL